MRVCEPAWPFNTRQLLSHAMHVMCHDAQAAGHHVLSWCPIPVETGLCAMLCKAHVINKSSLKHAWLWKGFYLLFRSC